MKVHIPEKVQSLYFSPTGNTRKVVDTILKGTGIEVAKPIDITLHRQRESWSGTVDGDLVIIGLRAREDKFILTVCEFRDKPDGMRNVFRIGSEGVPGGLGPPRAWST